MGSHESRHIVSDSFPQVPDNPRQETEFDSAFHNALRQAGYTGKEWITLWSDEKTVQLDGGFTADDLRKIAEAIDAVHLAEVGRSGT